MASFTCSTVPHLRLPSAARAAPAGPRPPPAVLDRGNALPEALDARRSEILSPRAGRIAYYADEGPAGHPLVLLHSINAAPSAFEMQPLFEHFRGRRPVFAPELPGYGHSERSRRPYSPELYAAAIEDFMTTVVKGPADVVAFSLSAEFAARAALAAPHLFSSLALLSPTGMGDRQLPDESFGRRMHAVLDLPLLGRGLYRLLTSRPSIRYFLNKGFTGEAPSKMLEYAHATARQDGAHHAPLYFLSLQLFTRDAMERLYGALELPALVLYDRDPNVGFERLPQLLESRPNWRAVRIEPTLGIPHWEQPAQTTRALEDFWHAPS